MPSFDYLAGNAPQAASYKAPDMAAQLYAMLGNLPQDTFNAQQNARTTKMQQPILGPDGKPTMNPSALVQGLAQVGGAQTQQAMLPQILAAQADAGIANKILNPDGGGSGGAPQPQQPPPTNSTSTLQAPAAFHAANDRINAAGDNASETARTLIASVGESAGGDRDIPAPVMKAIARSAGLSSPDDAANAQQAAIIRKNTQSYLAGGKGDREPPTNDLGARPVQAQSLRATPLGTPAESARDRAQAASIRGSATQMGANPNAVQSALAAAKALDERADKRDADYAKVNEPTTEQKNVESGATQKSGQIAADTKYYDTLHKGLAGSGMIAAQQKQNIDMLRQVANSPSFTPGFGSNVFRDYQRMAAQLGINTKNAAPREIFDQVSARILADQFSGMKSLASETGEAGGRIFKPMLDIEEKANITHEDTVEGIKAKLDMLDKTGDLMMRWADKADDYKKEHGKLDPGFDKALRADIAKARVENVVPKEEVKPPGGTPPPTAIQHLQSNPALRQQFDQKYGPGSAARALGGA